jgi:hypothetical protein
VPTWTATARFVQDYQSLSPDERKRFKAAVRKFVQDLKAGKFRKSLRIQGIEGADGIFEMTWEHDGRATFQYGSEIRRREPHIIWRRCGSHKIFEAP